ncbi:AzlC family ABC transporter permease [Alcaligenaceae bacterium]|nr:AzlC family ABC transporter permease [Alcaligenaceae bacterium]
MVRSKLLAWWPDAPHRQSFKQAFMDLLPTLVATGTWGFVTGIALVKTGLTDNMASLMTLTVYAGSAQLTALPLIESLAPIWLIFAAGCVVNIRFIIFGAALQPFFRHLSWFRRLMLSYLTTDMAFVLFMGRYGESAERGSTHHIWYMLGVIIPGWLTWVLASLMGIYLGGLVPASWSLEFAAILALMAIIIPLVKTKPMAMCLLAAGLIAWVCQPLPLRLGLALAVVGGVIAGVISERIYHRKSA